MLEDRISKEEWGSRQMSVARIDEEFQRNKKKGVKDRVKGRVEVGNKSE